MEANMEATWLDFYLMAGFLLYIVVLGVRTELIYRRWGSEFRRMYRARHGEDPDCV